MKFLSELVGNKTKTGSILKFAGRSFDITMSFTSGIAARSRQIPAGKGNWYARLLPDAGRTIDFECF